MKKNYYSLLIITIVLSLIGLLSIYSASYVWAEYRFNNPYKFVVNQGIFFFVGLFFIYVLSKVKIDYLKKYSNIILFITMGLLILVLIPGIGVVRNGSRSWFGIGSLGIQPSEFAKLSLIIFTSKYLSNNIGIVKSFKKGLLPILSVIAFTFILIMLEPDFGTGVVLLVSLMMILFVSKTKLSFFIRSCLLGLLGLCGLILVAPYRVKRIVSFINPWVDPLGSGFQIIQSLYAIGPGGLFGLGFMHSHQKHFYLPEPQTDFIFAIITEEFGFLGSFVLVSLFLLLFYLIMKATLREHDLFKKYLLFGFGFLIIFQAFLNIAIVIGLLPVTGITLPFISYGGSSLLINMLSMGIVLNIVKNQK